MTDIKPHNDTPFVKLTPRQALLAALSNCDDYNICVIVMAKRGEIVDTDGGADLYYSGAGDLLEIIALCELAKHHAMTGD